MSVSPTHLVIFRRNRAALEVYRAQVGALLERLEVIHRVDSVPTQIQLLEASEMCETREFRTGHLVIRRFNHTQTRESRQSAECLEADTIRGEFLEPDETVQESLLFFCFSSRAIYIHTQTKPYTCRIHT